jgi:hypothetical protein
LPAQNPMKCCHLRKRLADNSMGITACLLNEFPLSPLQYCHKPLKPGPDPVTPKPPAPKPPKSGALGNGGFGLNWAM